jgi:hypothetical protein
MPFGRWGEGFKVLMKKGLNLGSMYNYFFNSIQLLGESFLSSQSTSQLPQGG